MKLSSYKLWVKVALLLVLSLPLLGLPSLEGMGCGAGLSDNETSREKAAIRTAKDVPPTPQELAQAPPTGTNVPVSRPSSKLSVVPTSTTTPLRGITPFPRAKSVPTLTPTPTVSLSRSLVADVTRVIDGDTVDVVFQDGSADTVRLLGVDTPETFSSNLGDAVAAQSVL